MRPRRRWWQAGAAALALAAAVAVATVEPLQAAAQSFLDLFHAQRLQPVTLDRSFLASLPRASGPEAFGRFRLTGGGRQLAATPAEAESLLGGRTLYVLKVAGWQAAGGWEVTGPAEASLTLDRAKLEQYLRQAGWSDARLPQALDGATFTARIPAVAGSRWQGPGGLEVRLFQGAEPQLLAPAGLDPRLLEQLLLQAPNLPADLRRHLQALGDWRQVLPVPVPQGTVSRRASVRGALDALYLADPAGGGAGVLLWLEPGGDVLALAGHGLSEAQLAALAASVQAR